ncbi:Beta-1,4-galactosyltransferase 3 [Sparganum proliferum]
MRRSGCCCPPCGCLSKRHSCFLLAFLSIASLLYSYILLEFKSGTKQLASKTAFHESKNPSATARRFDGATERADEGLQERKRGNILEEFQELARIVNSTVEEFGLRLLRRWAQLEARFCSSLLSSAGIGFELFVSVACKETCTDNPGSKKRIALVIPIRDRWEHLYLLFRSLVPLLRSQNLCFLIVLAEQAPGQPFNKGLLMNAGVIEALNFMPFHCVAFHDVDLIPLSTNLSYACPSYPRHLSTQIDKFNFSLPYVGLVGGVLAVPLDQFFRVNGFSNMFWGWGAEDDDFFERLMFIGLPVIRPHPEQAKYVMLRHNKSKATDSWRRSALLALSFKRYRLDGLNTLIYSLKKRTLAPLGNLMPTDRQDWTDFGTGPVLHLLIEVTRRSSREPHGL